MHEFETKSLGLKGVIYGMAPVQAEGTIKGFSVYFWAKYNEWTFSVSEDPNLDPVDIQLPDFGAKYGFFMEAKYEGASYMETHIVLNLIEKCAAEYLKQRTDPE